MAFKLIVIFLAFFACSTYGQTSEPGIAQYAMAHLFGCKPHDLEVCLENNAVRTVRSLTDDIKTNMDKYMNQARRLSRKIKPDSNDPAEVQEIEKLQKENDEIIEKIRGKESKPNGLMDEISDLFTYGIAKLFGYFSGDKQSEDDLTEKIIQQADGRNAVEARGHKKKYLKKQNKHLKIILLLMLFKNKVKMFVHKLQFLLQLKFLGIAVVNLLINMASLYLEVKKHHKPHKVVYYENAHHQHHYDHEHLHEHDDGHFSHPGSHSHHSHHEEEYGGGPWPWSRSYIEKQSEQVFQNINAQKRPENTGAHNVVYMKQRPIR